MSHNQVIANITMGHNQTLQKVVTVTGAYGTLFFGVCIIEFPMKSSNQQLIVLTNE